MSYITRLGKYGTNYYNQYKYSLGPKLGAGIAALSAIDRTASKVGHLYRRGKQLYGYGRRTLGYGKHKPVRTNGQRRRKVYKKKKPRLSYRTKQQVRKVAKGVVQKELNKDNLSGHFTYLQNKYIPNGSRNKQKVFSGNGQVSFNWFSPAMIMDAASVMFNDKVATVNGIDTTSGKVGNFDNDIKIKIISGTAVERLTNNTLANVKCIHYRCHPKDLSTTGYAPDEQWLRAIDLYENMTAGNYAESGPNQLYDRPELYKAFTDYFRLEKKSYNLRPGKTVTVSFKKGTQVYDYTTLSDNVSATNYYQNVPGKNVWSLWILIPALQQYPLNAPPGIPEAAHQIHLNPAAEGQSSILHEIQLSMRIECPQEAKTENTHDVECRQVWMATNATVAAGLQAHKPIPGLVTEG